MDHRAEVTDFPDWSMFAFTAEPGSPSEERLRLLGSLSATSSAAIDPQDCRR